MFDYELTLVGGVVYEKDENGNIYATEKSQTNVLCDLKSVTRSEYYSAANAGLNPTHVFEINGFEYNGEQEVIFNGETFAVIRTYRTKSESIELTCERKPVNG